MKMKLLNETLKMGFSTTLFVLLIYFYPISTFKESLAYAIIPNLFGMFSAYLCLYGKVSITKINELDTIDGLYLQLIHWVLSAVGIYFGITLFILENSSDYLVFFLYYLSYRILVEILCVRFLQSQMKSSKIVFVMFVTIIVLICML